jgi:hypothetical protein
MLRNRIIGYHSVIAARGGARVRAVHMEPSGALWAGVANDAMGVAHHRPLPKR